MEDNCFTLLRERSLFSQANQREIVRRKLFLILQSRIFFGRVDGGLFSTEYRVCIQKILIRH